MSCLLYIHGWGPQGMSSTLRAPWGQKSLALASNTLGHFNQSISKFFKWPSTTTARTTSWMMSGYDCLNKKCFNSRRKVDSDLPQWRQLAVYSRCVEPQPQRLGCRLSFELPRPGLEGAVRDHIIRTSTIVYHCQSSSSASSSAAPSRSSACGFSTGGGIKRMLLSRSCITSIRAVTPCLRSRPPAAPPTSPSAAAGSCSTYRQVFARLVMALKWPIMCWCAVKKLLTR